MRRKFTSIFLALCMMVSCVAVSGVSTSAASVDSQAVSSGDQGPQSSIQGSAVLHCFDWSYNSIKANLKAIKDAGYTAVQTSPVQRPKDYSASYTSQTSEWWKLYQPISFTVADGDTWLGTKAELKSLCDEAEKLGIKVIVDIIFNHMANVQDSLGNSMSNVSPQIDSKLRSNSNYWHINSEWANNDNNRYSMTQGSIGEPDVNTQNSEIQQYCKQLLIDCINLGVDGFRFDTAKHIELPTDSGYGSQFWPTVINGSQSSTSNDIYYYGEVLNYGGTDISNYTKYMSITDNYTSDLTLVASKDKNATDLASSTYHKGAGANKSVLWVESHDTYMGDTGSAGYSNTKSFSNDSIVKAWAIVGSRANATSLFFARPAATMGAASTDTTWSSKAVAEVNKFKNYFDGETEYLSSSGSVAYNERGTSGVVISKLDGGGSVSLTANKMASGTYTDQVTGNKFTVSGGKISGTVGSTGVAVVYNATAPGPAATVTPGSSSYKTDTLTLTLGLSNATSGQYSIDGGSYQTFSSGKTITIGSGVAYGATTTVKVKATNGSETSAEQTYTYTKVDPSQTQQVYFDNTSYNWSSVYAYIYVGGTTTTENAAWPGVKMTLDSSTGYYVVDVPEGLENGRVIFTESYSTTTHRYPADGIDGMALEGKTKLFKAGNTFVEYSPKGNQTTATTKATQPTTKPVTDKILIGDVTQNGVITISDATEIQLFLAERATLSDKALAAADVNQDGKISIIDVTAIQYYLVQLTASAGKCGEYIGGDENPTTTSTTQPTTKATTPTTTQPTTKSTESNKVYFSNSNYWDGTISCYYWSTANTSMTSWPGQAMTFEYTNDYGQAVYSFTVPADVTNIIFTNGSSQTVDISFDGSVIGYYAESTMTGNGYNVGTWTP